MGTAWSYKLDNQKDELPICPSDENGILLPKKENCSEFYQCAGGVPFTHHCPENLYFCAEKEYCDYVDNCDYSNCELHPNNKPQYSPPVSGDIHIPAAVPECPPQVDQNLTLISNPDNCSSYYECDNGVPVLMDCPATLYFCTEENACTWIWEPNCTFNCLILDKEVPHVGHYNVEDTIHFRNKKNKVPHTKEKREAINKRSFH
jgi:hypothetical protein